MSKVKARAYCKSRGFGDFVHLHCPNGTNENNWLWFHHPWQPFQEQPAWQDAETGENHTYTDPLPGLITGVTRGRDFNNFDYWCDDDLYQSMDYFNWVWTQPKMMTNNNRVFANNIYLHLQHPGWYDTPKCDTQGFTELDDDGNVVEYKGCEGEGPYKVEDGTAGEPFDFHFICEMNCEMAEKERYVDRSGCDVECEDECYSGVCSIRWRRMSLNPIFQKRTKGQCPLSLGFRNEGQRYRTTDSSKFQSGTTKIHHIFLRDKST